MKISRQALDTLEFQQIRDMLAQECAWTQSKRIARAVRPTDRPRCLGRWGQEREEARELLEDESPPTGGLRDLRQLVRQADRGAVVEPEDLLHVAQAAETAQRLGGFLIRRRERFPTLSAWAELLEDISPLGREILQAVDEEGRVRDGASPRLRSIRRDLQTLSDRIRDRMEAMVRSSSERSYLQEPVITQRSGRYVVPVKREHRAKVRGLVHDQSGSGATLFVEPEAVVELNNTRRQRLAEEKAEVERILRDLASKVSEWGRALRKNQGYLARLDLCLARGSLSHRMKASSPILGAEDLVMKGARHPLLGPEAVPTTLELESTRRILVITGPNTGGKTVALKTAGLMVLMAQSGLGVPARKLEMPVFRQVFADIGDEQSLEQSLSTFSSHMRNIVPVTREADAQSLVLLDEIGAGTDPQEGTALAMAILEEINQRRSFAIATTHYSELKAFAYLHPGMENASMEFDLKTLSPTYRLIMGLPGRSNAFEIARRLGLPEPVLERASNLVSSEAARSEDLIVRMQDSLREYERLAEEARRDREEAEGLRRRWEEKERQQARQRREILEQARTEALDVVSEAKEETRQLIQRLRELEAASRSDQVRSQEWEAVRSRLTEMEQETRSRLESPASQRRVRRSPGGSYAPGQPVHVISLGQEGQVVTEPDESGTVMVQVGALKIRVGTDDLAEGSSEEAPSQRGVSGSARSGSLFQSKAQRLAPEISVRGLTVDEALEKLDKYLDDAVLAGLSRVVIIHGKGTGALRRAISGHLRRHRQVDRHHLGEPSEGGSGATIAYLSQD